MEVRKTIKKTLTLLLILITAAAGSTLSVSAADKSDCVPDLPAGPYSLEITVQSSNPDGSSTGINGAKLSVYKAADLTVKHGGAYYKTTADFEESGLDFEDMTAEESNAAAKALEQIAEKKALTGRSGICDESGKLVFSNLEPGIYLVKLDEYSDSDSEYTAMDPFLVLVPGIDKSEEENTWISNVCVIPKIEINPAGSIEVNLPVLKKVKGNPKTEETFTFELKADEITNPMPAGSVDGTKRSTVKGAGQTEFGAWKYTEPGIYEYTVCEVSGSSRNYEYDKTVYHLTDTVYYAGSKLKVEHKLTDAEGKEYTNAEFVFTNTYTEPGISPKTGDEMKILIWLTAVVLGAGFMLAAVKRRGRGI